MGRHSPTSTGIRHSDIETPIGMKPHGRGGDYVSVGVDVGILQAGHREQGLAERLGPSGSTVLAAVVRVGVRGQEEVAKGACASRQPWNPQSLE